MAWKKRLQEHQLRSELMGQRGQCPGRAVEQWTCFLQGSWQKMEEARGNPIPKQGARSARKDLWGSQKPVTPQHALTMP